MTGEREHPVRQFGPTASAVLTVLHEQSVAADGELLARVSIRGLALELGLGKNTVQRALRRLSAAGMIEAQQRRTNDGTFAAGHYVLTAAADVQEPTKPFSSRSADDPRTRTSGPSTSARSDQLTLGI